MAGLLNSILDQSRLVDLEVPRLEEVSETRYIISDLYVLFSFGAMCRLNNRFSRDIGVCRRTLISRTRSHSIITEEHRVEVLRYAILDTFKVGLLHGGARRPEYLVVLDGELVHQVLYQYALIFSIFLHNIVRG